MIIGPAHNCPGNRLMYYVHQSACSGHQMWLTHVMRKFHPSLVIGLSLAAHCAAQGKLFSAGGDPERSGQCNDQ